MMNFEQYINDILRSTYLRKREKQAWKEEMLGHLEEATASSVSLGAVRDEAIAHAMNSFGHVAQVRRRIIRETYGLSPRWFLLGSVLSFVGLVVSLFVNMRVGDINPHNMRPIPTPDWVLFLRYHFPMSFAAWAGLIVVFLMLIYTRKQTDRIAVFASIAPFFLVWMVGRMGHHFFLSALFFAGSPIMQPFGQPELIGYMVLFVLSVSLYLWTHNRMISLTPWAVTIALTMWPLLRDTVQTALWHWTNNDIFWGHSWPYSYVLWYAGLTLIIRCIVLCVYLYVCKKLDRTRVRKSSAV